MNAQKEPKERKSDQLNVRVDEELRARLERWSAVLKIDKTSVVTMLLTAFLDKLDKDGTVEIPLKITVGKKKASY